MIVDSLQQTKAIEALHPLFPQAFEYLRTTDFSAMEDGVYPLIENELIVNIQRINGKPEEEAVVETHRQYIDIQLPLEGCERLGWTSLADLHTPTLPYQADKDIAFWAERPTSFIDLKPGLFAVFFPEDGHAPGIASGEVRKIVVKIKAI